MLNIPCLPHIQPILGRRANRRGQEEVFGRNHTYVVYEYHIYIYAHHIHISTLDISSRVSRDLQRYVRHGFLRPRIPKCWRLHVAEQAAPERMPRRCSKGFQRGRACYRCRTNWTKDSLWCIYICPWQHTKMEPDGTGNISRLRHRPAREKC